jgi:5-methyltetrahydropteroyltriglutamate--homocysteine methyltransferase
LAIATNLGYPRIGRDRELKKATEAYWSGKIDQDELGRIAADLRAQAWRKQADAGIQLIPSNDFSFYDHVLDTIALSGAVPPNYEWNGNQVDIDTYFAMARGSVKRDLPALEMTKWFNSNYHYIVPEFWSGMKFSLSSSKPFDEFSEAKVLGFNTKPVLVGPVTFLLLGKVREGNVNPLDLLDDLLPVYQQVLEKFQALGAEWVQFDEPAFVSDRSDEERQALTRAYDVLAGSRGSVNLTVQTYFDRAGESYETLVSLPVQAIGLDFVHGREGNLRSISERGFPDDKTLVAGVIDGRNIWINDLNQSLTTIESLPVAPDKLMVGPSSSLMFVPIDVRMEDQLDHELREWLAFADQKLAEIATVTNVANRGREESGLELGVNAALLHRRSSSEAIHHPEVKQRAAAVTDDDASRGTPFTQRREEQRRRLGLPLFPTTTVGSFPQTPEVRRARRQALRNEITAEEYDRFIEEQVKHVISFQEELGLDVLVHGEFERSDMVEYFGERMKGFAFTRHGWVQSYGSRYVRPPVIFGDVSRPEPMTVRWFEYAQSLTEKPVKGMLTGPVTILNWSFVRDDQPRSETCMQIALALRDEVTDLEKAGARVIQIDEPALREGLPLREEDWAKYLDWAIAAFRVAASGVEPGTQIHTHMCYSDFNSIIDSIQAMDADVVSIENSRSDLELLDVFKRVSYANEIGPGVYDIHSPRVPSDDEMAANLEAAAGVLSVEQLWVNPDCGLKTRRWEEVEPSLKHMISAAQRLREQASVPA